MLSATRIPTVTARSLLLPPVRVPIRALQWFCRPQCPLRRPPCPAQRRSLNLYKTARAKTPLGMHKVLTFSPYKLAPPSQSEQRVNLIENEKVPPVMVAENLTLQELYDNHIKPGEMLYYVHTLNKSAVQRMQTLKSDEIAGVSRNYAIVKAHSTFASVSKGKKSLHFNALKVIPFELTTPVHHFKHVLDRMYQFIELGCPIEVRVRLKGAQLSKEARLEAGDATMWPWVHDRFPHTRPDVLLRSMPKGTIFLIKPWSDGRHVQWVMCREVQNMPQMNMEKGLVEMQQTVKKSIQQGRQAQLPAMLRQRLREQGQEEYSADSGLPRSMATSKYGGEKGDPATFDCRSADGVVPDTVSPNRYLVSRSKPSFDYGLLSQPEKAKKAEKAKKKRHHWQGRS